MSVILQQQTFVASDWGEAVVANGTATVTQQFAFAVAMSGTLASGATVTVVEQNPSHTTVTMTCAGIGSNAGFVLVDGSGNEYFFANTTLGVGSQSTVSAAGLGDYHPPPRTLLWTGAQGTDFAVAGDWNDTSNPSGPAAAAPGGADTAEFLNGGGTIIGDGTAATLEFGGTASWNVTSGASLNAGTGVLVGLGGVGILLINDGAGISGLGASDTVSGTAGSAASVTVDGVGSTWTSASELIIGDAGAGAVTVSNKATLGASATLNTAAVVLGQAAGGNGTLTVTGEGSRAILVGQLDVGQAGAGSLTVSSGGTVITGGSTLALSQGIDVAQTSGGSGVITVSGAQSLLENTGGFIVGDSGVGGLSIGAGAVVVTTPGSVAGLAGLMIGDTTAASGSTVNVYGAGSNLEVTGTVVVGNAGSGALLLSAAASVTAGALDVAAGATGNGAVSMVGVGTSLNVTGSLILGDNGAGELSVLGGAHLTVAGGVVGGTGPSAAGNLDVEGQGSLLTINGGTLVVGANGPAEFTLGIGATLSGEVATDLFGVTNEYGNVDPATDPNDGTQNVGFGNSLLYDFFVANSGTIKITSGTATFYTPLVTDETNAQDGSTNGLWVIGAKDTLVMNATSVDNTQTFDFTSATAASLVIGQVPQGDINNLDTLNGATTPTMTGSIAPGAANVLAGWQAPIENYQSGDVIRLQGLTYGSATVSGDVVTVWSGAAGGGSALGSLVFIDKSDSTTSAAALADAAAAQVQINSLACFAEGTRIATPDGWLEVQHLRVGDRVVTHDGCHEPIVWAGSRAVDCARHPRPETVWPVRVSLGAFGHDVPRHDLYLSPDHAVFVNGVLVPVKLLINGTSIAQVKQAKVTYFHVELPRHAVILAEGLTVESYLDIGDRENFHQHGATIRLFPDFAGPLTSGSALAWETRGAAPLVMAGEELWKARRLAGARMPRRASRSDATIAFGRRLPAGRFD